MRCCRWILPALVLLATVALAGEEPDWFTRVQTEGLKKASAVEVERFERGVLEPSLHVGECYYELGRYEEGVAVFRRLLRSPDRNYAAAALARVGEGQYHLGKREEAKRTFTRCLEENPEAWLDGSVAERCRAWLEKIDGRLVSPDREGAAPAPAKEGLEALKAEVKELESRLAELKRLIEKLRNGK